ncbi:hypothetical protein BH11MYX1_BH11MYX1_02760 [soil metagenome]
MMRALLAATLLTACGFHPGAAPAGDGGARDGGARDGAPDAFIRPPNCYGTGYTVVCPAVLPNVPFAVTTTTPILTDVGSSACAVLSPTNDAVCVVAGTSVTISSFLSAHGQRPLVVLSLATLDVSGEIDVNSSKNAPGAGFTGVACPGTAPTLTGGGGFGGSFGSKGGNGGATVPPGGLSGEAFVPTALRGGCAGGPGKDVSAFVGLGGGAVALIAVNGISVLGTINASGSSGGAAVVDHSGGNGGGTGGMIVLDGESISVGANTEIFANGGGGGGGESSTGFDGGDGSNPSSSNTGGGGGAGGGITGGDGGAGATLDGSRSPVQAQRGDDASTGAGDGGGGGGFGVIKIFRATMPASAELKRFSPRPI